MELTNKYGLPSSFVNFARNDKYSKGNADISVTTLIDSPRVNIMRSHHAGDLTKDVSDMVWPLFGTAVHHILDQSDEGDHVLKEERLFMDVNGWVLSGAIDRQEIVDGKVVITDYKVTSVWSVIYGKIEWELQQNVYAHMVRKVKGLDVSAIRICVVIRDWSRRDAQFKPEYPKSPIVIVDLPLWSHDDAEEYITDRVVMHQSAQIGYDTNGVLPLCSAQDRWAKDDSYAVKKTGGKRAVRVLPTQKEAEDFLKKSALSEKNHFVEKREGENTRCDGNYCSVADWCEQYNNLKGKRDE